MSRSVVTAVAVVVGLAGGAVNANAQTPDQERHVSYSDLDLNDNSDARRMLRRIERAARSACDDRGARHMRAVERADARACVNTATEQAVASLDSPLVTALHQGDELPVQTAELGNWWSRFTR